MAEHAYQRQAPGAGALTERARGAVTVVLLLLVPAAFVAGWRARQGFSRMMGYERRRRLR